MSKRPRRKERTEARKFKRQEDERANRDRKRTVQRERQLGLRE